MLFHLEQLSGCRERHRYIAQDASHGGRSVVGHLREVQPCGLEDRVVQLMEYFETDWKSYQGYKAYEGWYGFSFQVETCKMEKPLFRFARNVWQRSSLKGFWMTPCLAQPKSATHQDVMVNCEFNQWNAWRPMQWLLSNFLLISHHRAERAHWFLGLQRCN